MTDAAARSPRAFALALAMAASLAVATQAGATAHHHSTTTKHEKKSGKMAKAAHGHSSTAKHGSTKKPDRKPKAKPAPAAPKPAGATSVPAGGLKVFCPAGRSPLMVRKMTQGNGTTVTILCR